MDHKADCLKTIRNYWCYKWTPVLAREGVKGPLTQPMLAIPFPYTYEDDGGHCNCEEEVNRRYRGTGIPDPWKEYVAVKNGTEKGCLSPDQFKKKDLNITKYLGENFPLDFGQGIPDPWKKCVSMKHSNREYLQGDFRNYFEKLKAELYESDKICCPNCNRQLLVFCLKGLGRRRKRRNGRELMEEPLHEVEVEKPIEETHVDEKVEETVSQEKLPLKDACVETDEIKEEIKLVQVCKCKEDNFCYCSRVRSCECDTRWKMTKSKICRCRKDDDSSDSSCSCGKHRSHDFHTPLCFPNFLPFLPRLSVNQQLGSSQGLPTIPNEDTSVPGREQQQGQPTPYVLNNSNVPQFPPQLHPYSWFPSGFFPCGGRNGHFMELKWVCQKCEKGKKKKRKGKHRPAHITPGRHECKPCLCKESKRKSSKYHSSSFYDYEDDSDSCEIHKICHVRNGNPQNRRASEKPRCHCDEETSKAGNNSNEEKPDRDFIQLLQMLGCPDLYQNKRNTDYNEPMVNLNMAADSSEVVGTSRSVSQAYVSMPGFPKPNFSHWKQPPNTQSRRFDPIRSETCNTVENTSGYAMPLRKTVTFQGPKPKPSTVKTTYTTNSTADNLRNVETVVRKRNRASFKKDLNYFISKYDTNWFDSGKSSSWDAEEKKTSDTSFR